MPNYSLVVNSQFKPFSYAELAAPVMEMSNYHEKLAQEYDNLSKQADVLEMLGGNDRDKSSNSYNKYKSYSDSLRKEADDLFANGLNLESRRRLTDLRRMYNTDIVPIQTAYAKREQEAAQQMQAYLQNPHLMFTRDANNSSIDEYVSNPNGGYGVINGATITAQMSAMAQNLAKQIRSGRRENIDDYTYNYIMQHGLDENMIRNWQDSPTLSRMFSQVMKANGVSEDALKNSLNAQNIIDKSRGYAEMGMWNAMGEDKAEKVDNFGARQALELDIYRKKKEIDAQYAQQQTGAGNLINPLPLRSQQEISENNEKIQEYIKKGYVKQDPVTGQWSVTHKGWNEYRKAFPNHEKKMAQLAAGESSSDQHIEAARKMPDTVPSEFKKFMDGLNGGKSLTDSKGNVLPGWGPRRAGNMFAQAIKDNQEGSYDTYHSTEYDRQLSSSYGDTFAQQLWSAARMDGDKKVLDVVDYNGKDGWKSKGTVGVSDLDGYKATNVRYSKWGNTAILQKDGKEPVRVKIPKGMNLGAEFNVNNAIGKADDFGEVLHRGKVPMIQADKQGNFRLVKDAKGNIMYTNEALTPEDRVHFEKYRRDALNEMSSYGSQFVVPSETEAEKYKRFGF